MESNQASMPARRKAGFWVRFASLLIDVVIIGLILEMCSVLLELFGMLDNFEIIAAIAFVAYLGMFVGGNGRTVGKLLCGVTVRHLDGRPVCYLGGFLRELIGKLVSGLFLLLGFFWVGVLRSKRGWHDYIAGTIVEQDLRAVKRGRIVLAVVLASGLSVIGVKASVIFVESRSLQARNVLKAGTVDVSSLTDADYEPFVTYLKDQGATPIEYITSKFNEHDVIILGEIHEVRETCQLIADLAGPLYHQAGVRVIAMEAFKYKNTTLANQLVTGKTYDDELALTILRDCAWPIWGFQEYIDILKAIWKVNQALPAEAEKLKVLCLDSDLDMTALVAGQRLWRLPDLAYRMVVRDQFMAKLLTREVLEKDRKTLVHIGNSHAYTRYRRPIVKNEELVLESRGRLGSILHQQYGSRILHVALHQWSFPRESVTGDNNVSPRKPMGGVLEKIFAKNNNTPVGFDVFNSPFADLRDNEDCHFAFQQYVTFSDIAEGYVFLRPLDELHKTTWADGFVNEANHEILRAFLRRRAGIDVGDRLPHEELNDALRQWYSGQDGQE